MTQSVDESPARLVGSSALMRAVRERVNRCAANDLPVLLRGATGTGKDLAARSIHEHGARRHGPFIPINCATLGPQLADSTLFGHVRGAFTGAHRDHEGAFERAHEGTLFLDEIGELALPEQAKLLRALENRRITPVGSERDIEVHPRVIAATHRDLVTMVRRGTFREDLYHRLCVLTIELPALSSRPQDIPELIAHLSQKAERELGRPVHITANAVAAAGRCRWPGNVRGLKNAIMRAATLFDGPIEPAALIPDELPPPPLLRAGSHASIARDTVEIPRGDYRTMNRALLELEVERHGSINRAAAALDIPRSTLSAWLRRGRSAS